MSRGHCGMKMTAETTAAKAVTVPAHERVYRSLRQRILTGGFLPGRPVTLRGIATQLGVSPMPRRVTGRPGRKPPVRMRWRKER